MHQIYASIYIQDKPQEIITINEVDFEENVEYLKKKIGKQILYNDVKNLDLVFDGRVLENDLKLGTVMREDGVVHCFRKTKHYEPYKESGVLRDADALTRVQDLFTLIANVQMNVTSRVTILQKILNEYPEFRRNLGAQAIIRDSVLFNTIHQPETTRNIAEQYPIICEAAPFIVYTVKKEILRSAASTAANPSGDSPNSSEEENSLGASSSSASLADNGASTQQQQAEDSQIRAITRQQLQEALALAQINVANNTSSINSLSNIAQRNTQDTAGAGGSSGNSGAQLSTSASGERISAEMFRQHIQRALSGLSTAGRGIGGSASGASSSSNLLGGTTTTDETQQMDTTEAPTTTTTTADDDNGADDGGDIPAKYRNHEYAEQLRTMAQMGFPNHEQNLVVLILYNGNISYAVNMLTGSMN